ncbi:hypothetical protein E3P99_00180 [Wallemia hederae]|uniref:Uncharacterized protein n=1 Tax=Wallemia hederae TaxID=1540922 RepID=A0A4T0FX00_9BASI|nr:hypothetical protein E3P99_00180 [Wallemia hederae]
MRRIWRRHNAAAGRSEIRDGDAEIASASTASSSSRTSTLMIVTGIAVSIIALLLGFGTIPLVQVLDDRFQYNIGGSFDHLRKLISASTTPILEAPPVGSIKEANSATLLIDLVRIAYYYGRLYKFRLVSLLYSHKYDTVADMVTKTTFWQLLMVSASLWLVSAAGFIYYVLNKPVSATTIEVSSENPAQWQLDEKSTDYSKLLVPESNASGTQSNHSSVRSAKSSPRSPLNQQDNALGLDIDKSELPVQSTITKSELAEASFRADEKGEDDDEDDFKTPANHSIGLPEGESYADKARHAAEQAEQVEEVDEVDIDDSASIRSTSTYDSQKWQPAQHAAREGSLSNRSSAYGDLEQSNLFTNLETEEAPAMQTPIMETVPSSKSSRSTKSQRSQRAREVVKSISRTPSKMMKRMSNGSSSTSPDPNLSGYKKNNAFSVLDDDDRG